MYSLFGLEKNIETLLLLSSLNGDFPQNTEELKQKYRNYLKSIQDHQTVSRASGTELIWNHQDSMKLVEIFGVSSVLNDLNQDKVISQEPQGQREFVRDCTIKAMERFRQLEPSLHQLFQTVIEKIFFAGSTQASGGSSSSALGCIWLNPRSWSEQDYLEFFVHELTHNLLFLDERREVHYPHYAALDKAENYAFSAILKRERPLDKVIHSLFVVYEVLAFRLKHFNPATKTFLHPDTKSLFQGAEDTLRSLVKIKPELTSQHLKEMISKLEADLRLMKRNCYENQKYINL